MHLTLMWCIIIRIRKILITRTVLVLRILLFSLWLKYDGGLIMIFTRNHSVFFQITYAITAITVSI